MKKILLLGGSAQQVVAIETAKQLGYFTILCDFLPDNPGQYAADKFYLVSTTDKEAVLKVAEEEGIDGVLAYASDPAAPTAAYVAEKMRLPGNPYESVEILCNKDKFRAFLKENGFCTPEAKGYTDVTDALKDIQKGFFKYPMIVKPVDSSGSKGATVLQNEENLEEALNFAFAFSRCHRIIVEKFIEKKHPFLIGGDILVIDGKIIMWGLLNCHRDSKVNLLVPVGKSYPLQLEKNDIENVKNTLTLMVNKLGIRNGAMNVEAIIDKNNLVWLIDVGPRSGGNMIPELLGDMFGINIAKISVEAAMGNLISIKPKVPDGCYATYNLHSKVNGTYKGVLISEKVTPYIYRKCFYKTVGDAVEFFDNASKCLGIVFMKFPNEDILKSILKDIDCMIVIEVQEEKIMS